MRSLWKKCLALALGSLATVASAQEVGWRPVASSAPAAPAAALGRPIASSNPNAPAPAPAATLGKPVAIASSRPDDQVRPASFAAPASPGTVFRGAAPDAVAQPMPGGTPASPTVAAGLHSWRRADEAASATVKAVPPGQPVNALHAPALNNHPAPYGNVPFSTPMYNGRPAPLANGPLPGAPGTGMPSLYATDCAPQSCGTAQCGTGCLPEACPPGNLWYVGAEYLLWKMRGDNTPPLVTGGAVNLAQPSTGVLGQPGTQTLFGGERLGDDLVSGGRLTVGMWFNQAHYWGVEASGFYLGRQNDDFSAVSLGDTILARPIVDLRPFVVSGGMVVANPAFGQESRERVADPGLSGSVDVSRTSTLWGVEGNLRRGVVCCENGYVDLLVGFRGLGLDENLQITERLTTRTVNPPIAFTVMDRFETTNRFYGGQIGFDSEYRYNRWSLGLKSKLALGNTQQTADLTGGTSVRVGAGPATGGMGGLLVLQGTNLGRYVRNEFSIIPEVGLTLGYQLTPWCRATVGYNFLYWTNVLRPGGTIDRGVNATYQPFSPISPDFAAGVPARPAPIFDSTDFWAQGLTLGLELRW